VSGRTPHRYRQDRRHAPCPGERLRLLEARQLRPVTERILANLPGPRVPWIVLWALVPSLNAGVNLLLETGARSAVWEQSGTVILLNYGALSFGIVIALWGSERIARRLEALRPATSEIFAVDSTVSFRGMNSVAGPLVASAATAVALAIAAFVDGGWAAALLRGATWLIVGVALWAFLWTYASLQLGLDRLGREHLRPDATSVDPSLGLGPLGGVAFTALWMLLAWLVPVVLTGLPDVVGVAIGLGVLFGGLATFVLSLVRLHRQMVEVKAGEIATARELYAQAYEPVRSEQTLEALERQRSLLAAADALEKRAEAIHEWPIDEGIWARVITIATSVVAITVARLILEPLGL
jgi:hypothetical protein